MNQVYLGDGCTCFQALCSFHPMSCFSIIFIFSCLSDKNSTFLGVMVPDVKLSSNYQMA